MQEYFVFYKDKYRGEQMKTVLTAFREKLNTLGYNESIINSILNKLNLKSFEEHYLGLKIPDDLIHVTEFDEPNVEMSQLLLCITPSISSAEVLEGDIAISSSDTSIGTRFAIADYSLDKRSAVIGISTDYKAEIIVYKPSSKTLNLYKNMTYEQAFKRDRDDITRDYYEAFVDNGRVTERKVKEILTMLVANYVIDEMAVYDANPKIKLYDNEQKYAENLYSYSLRYINLRSNRIEILNKSAKIKLCSKNVQTGLITNDPYIKIDQLPPQVDFPLNTVSYYWLYKNKANQEELAVFVPPRMYPQAMYSELKKEDPRIDEVTQDLVRKFKREANFDIDPDELKKVVEKLNIELMAPSISIIRANLVNKSDLIEPIKYKYQIITDPAEFEEKLYITIEDNVSRRYKYMLAESVLDDLTTIGNKLEYTDEKGNLVRKQSIADFNVNAPAIIIRRETFTDITKIPDLLGYIYEDMEYYGTDALPIPSIEVDFYVPNNGIDRTTVSMYNGTMPENGRGQKQNLFNSSDSNMGNYVIGSGNALPGSTYVTVRYVTSKGEILKENKIGNVFPNTSFLPDVIPIINDKEGREWKAESNVVTPFIITSHPEENVVEIKYIEKYTRVNITFINREGKNICPDKQEMAQVGETFDLFKRQICKDSSGDEWKLVTSRPEKLIAKEDENQNKIILVYDIERADITIEYVTLDGISVAQSKIVQSAVEKMYTAEKIPFIIDENGLGWDFVESSNTSILVKNNEENVVKLLYQEAKRKVTTRIKNLEEIVLKDDSIQFVQIGKKVDVHFDAELKDYELKEWKLNSNADVGIIVNEDEEKNLIEGIYTPKLAKVAIKFLNVDGRPIKDSEIVDAQVGARYNAENKMEVMDNFGKMWKWKDKSEGILVSEIDNNNSVSLIYEPLIAKVTMKYLDAEMKELIAPKYEMLQAGTVYKNTPILKITDAEGKKWVVDQNKVPTITVKKYEEENIVSIYYDKETTKVNLTFFDAYNNELKEMQEIDAQIGAKLDTNLFFKITDIHNNRWMFATSEPKNLTVREVDNNFKLIYDEMKAKVLVKHINVNTEKSFVEDIISTVKLGGIYVPNIRQKVLDKNKWQYKYIGDENISIVTQENEQENIIILPYDEDRSKVILKYRNHDDQKIREDAIKEVQIGKEITIDAPSKFTDNEGLGWSFVSADMNSKVVLPEDNIIVSHYEPLKAPIINQFINEEEKEIIHSKEEELQVGKKYVPTIMEKVTDSAGAAWKYESISASEIIAKDETNIIVHHYSKLLAKVVVNFIGEENELITDPFEWDIQVGTVFVPQYETNYTSPDDRAWIFDSISNEKIIVQEENEKNIINVKYRKELVDVTLNYFNPALAIIKNADIVKAQIGSLYTPSPVTEIIDSKGLGWALIVDMLTKTKLSRDSKENSININYEELLVDVTVKYQEDKNKDVIKPLVEKRQVGTTYMPEISDYIEDEEGKEWIHALKLENKFFSSGKKVEPIKVNRDDSKNLIILHYKPSMAKVIVRYVDPLGTEIRPHTQTESQIGGYFTPEILEKIIGTAHKKWTYNPNSNATIRMSREENKNVVNLAYEEEKSSITYVYKTDSGTILKEEKKILAQIGTIFRVEPEKIIEDTDGKVWEYHSKERDEIKVEEDEKKNIVEIIYAPLMVNAVLKYVTLNGRQIIPDQIQKAQLGSEFKPFIERIISDEESKKSKFMKCEPESLKMQETPLDAEGPVNVFTLTYEALFSKARIIFRDIDGNSLRDDEVSELQVGTVFSPSPIQFISDRNGIQWELVTKEINPIVVKEDEKDNEIVMAYEVAKAEVSVRYRDIDGNAIKDSSIYHLEVGSEFIPEIEHELVDKKNRKWTFNHADPVKLTVGSINNIINVIYQEKKAMTVVKIQTTDGRTLKQDIRLKQQIGTIYSPQPQNRVIYDNNDMWKFSHNSPSQITISENTEENVIIQYYSNETTKVDTPENANGYTAEMEKFIDKDLAAAAEKEEQEKIAREEEEKKKLQEEKATGLEVQFTDEYLQKLERTISLTNSEKQTINDLNDLNTKIVKTLHDALEAGDTEAFGLKDKLSEIMRAEKELVQQGLSSMIEEDKSGNKILKIFEAITSSEMSDSDFQLQQQKKSVIFADYFINNKITDMEQANYIIDRGKVQSGIKCINRKINASATKELMKAKIILLYEEAMLDNYYRARSVVKDDYFNNPESREKMPTNIVIQVTNSLPNQAIKLFNRCLSLSVLQENELEAIIRLLSEQQLTTVSNGISKIQDGKTRKAAQKIFKNFVT